MANTTLIRRDAYLSHLKMGIKPDTLSALRTGPLHIATLFPDTVLKQAEQDIANFESKGQVHAGKKGRYHPYERQDKRPDYRKPDRPSWKNIGDRVREAEARPPATPRDQPRASSPLNDNYFVNSLQEGLLAGSQTLAQKETLNFANFHVVKSVPSAPGHSQKRELSPGVAACQTSRNYKLKYVNSVSCVTQLCPVQPVVNAPNFAQNLPVGARLQSFWKTWLNLGAGPKVVQILREGYSLPFRIRPQLTRSPTVISRYVNPHRNSYLLEALHQLIDKKAVERVQNPKSLGFFNRLFLVPKPNNKWRPILDLSNLNVFLKVEKFKMETPETIRTSLQQGEWVTSVDFKDAYFHIPIQEQSRKYLRFHVQGRTYQFKALPFGLSTAPMEFTVLAKEVKLMAIHKGIRIHQYLDDWLVRARSQHLCLQHTRLLVKMCQNLGWLVNLEKSELEPKQVFDFVGYQFDLRSGRVRPTPDRWQSLQDEIQALLSLPTCPVRQLMSLIGLLTATEKQVHLGRLHETHTVAPQKQLEGTRISGEDYPSTKVPASSLTMVARRRQGASRPTVTPSKTCSANFYRRIKRRVGRSLKRVYYKGVLVGTGKQAAHKPSGTKSSFPSIERVPRSLCRKNSSGSNRQYYSSSLHKQGRGNEVGPTVCPTVENLDLVFPATSNSQSSTHSRTFKCDSRQTLQAGSDHPDRVVPPSGSFSTDMQPMAPASNRPFCHEVQPQITSVCLSSTGLPGCSSRCTYPAMGGPGCIRLPTDRHIGQSGGEASGLPLQETRSDCPGVAQHAMVLGLGEHVQPGPSQPAQPAQSANTAIQSDPSQKSDQPKSPFLAPRATKIKEQGFSEAVAAIIEAPQRRSTRSVYEAKWTIFKKWCVTSQVDFRSPPIKSVADFLMYVFEDKKLQPSTIDGYRSAIADKLGDTTVNISKDDNLTRLLESFHRDRPKGRRGIPSWNLSLVLHQLTKAPFEPLKEASLKHLTFKTVFLLALGSGKRRSEIHAWQHKNIRHQSDWSKVSLFPSPSFLSKNQLAKEGPGSVAPVVIPALAPTLDRSLKSDRSLCPVRALRYYLDRTSDIRQDKQLVFVSFKKGFDKDISPATISSWIKQTVILCYELSDHQAHTLHQVKAHDVRAFAASKAFQSGVSLEQILSACHWKSHNTFTQFYLKDVAWADSELYHLGPVVAAQQIHQRTDT